MYSEHMIAALQKLVQRTYTTGADLDADRKRPTVQIGRVIGTALGYRPSDAALAWHARATGTPAPIGTRGAVHVLPSGLVGIGLGAGRGTIETAGYNLAIVARPEPGRYTGAWRLPTIQYGGLI